MIPLLLSAAAATALVVGALLIVLWCRRALLSRVRGGLDPAQLEVLARTGLHNNQGLAVVRVGTRYLLVSSGEGGVRTLARLSSEELWPEPAVVDEEPDLVEQPSRFASILRNIALIALLFAIPMGIEAQVTAPAVDDAFAPVFEALPPVTVQMGTGEEGLRLSGTVGTVVVLGLLTLAPTLLLLTTSFTRILVVLHLLRQALGTQTTPPGHLLAGLALLLTAVVMAPTAEQVRVTAVDPWLAGQIDEGQMLVTAAQPIRMFMLAHTRESDLRTFLAVSRSPMPLTPQDVPTVVLLSAFVTSELRAAFEIGFALFLPFIVIDLVVAAVLTSMGMFMLPPTMIALPCKLLLFVLMDGWSLLLGTLAQSFV